MSSTIKSFFLGTRIDSKKYGPQSRDMEASELITLLARENTSTQYVMPDFSGLARHIDEQIKGHFIQQKDDDFFRQYRLLSDSWYQAGSISKPENRSRRFERIMEESQKFLVYSHEVMPHFNPYQLNYYDVEKICIKGKMYCLGLLFHIIARTAFDPESIAADVTLIRHCKWMKDWIKNTAGERFLHEMMVNIAITNPVMFPSLQHIGGNKVTQEADTFLAQQFRADRDKNEKCVNHNFLDMEVNFKYRGFSNEQYKLLNILRDLHFRIDRLELLLSELSENIDIDFTAADEAGEWINSQVEKIKSDELKQLPNAQ